ncbi:DUF1566 domain-containing protein [bacterium]|nr:DUF1566 domain-containing protein [bacterium]
MEAKEIFKEFHGCLDKLERVFSEKLNDITPKRFIDNKDNTVTDTKTGLTWIKDHTILGDNFTKTMVYEEAIESCKKLDIAGHKDWRLPTREELLTIVDLTRHSPAIYPIFVNTKTDDWYWTSTPCVRFPGSAWLVGFSNGYVVSSVKGSYFYVRPVRSSQ